MTLKNVASSQCFPAFLLSVENKTPSCSALAKSAMGMHLHHGESEETEIASDLRIGYRKFERAKQRNSSQEAVARIPDTKKECALSPF
jgi:hypothetical protein